MSKNLNVRVPVGDVELEGNLHIPNDPAGLVVFVHGSGSSRFSPRNQQVATELNQNHFATLLFDLLTPEEDQMDQIHGRLRFDIPVLARRVGATIDWLHEWKETRDLPMGLFGASTGAAAAIVAAADRPSIVRCIISRGGRPDLADKALDRLMARTLLIVGENDPVIMELNLRALARIPLAELEIIPDATHLFEEPGALEQTTDLAITFFELYLQTLLPV